MRHIAHIGLVDPHPERHGRYKAHGVFLQERILIARPHTGIQSGVIRQGRDALLIEKLGNRLDLGARQAIDDAAFAFMAPQKIEQLRPRIGALDNRIADIGTIKARYEKLRLLKPRRSIRSARVVGSAVAVSATRGTWGNNSRNLASSRYSGRKSWPHWLTQWASSMANSPISTLARSSRNPAAANRSGAT